MKKVIFPAIATLVLVTVASACLISCKSNPIRSAELMDSIQYKKSMPEWAKDCNIYEVNIRQYTPEGTFKAFQQHLPRLKEMGVDIIWLMPINPIGKINPKENLEAIIPFRITGKLILNLEQRKTLKTLFQKLIN